MDLQVSLDEADFSALRGTEADASAADSKAPGPAGADFAVYKDTDSLAQRMLSLLASGLLSDVTLVCGKEQTEIKAHRAILVASSEYFRALLAGKFAESTESRVALPELKPHIATSLLTFCYGGELKLSAFNCGVLHLTCACSSGHGRRSVRGVRSHRRACEGSVR